MVFFFPYFFLSLSFSPAPECPPQLTVAILPKKTPPERENTEETPFSGGVRPPLTEDVCGPRGSSREEPRLGEPSSTSRVPRWAAGVLTARGEEADFLPCVAIAGNHVSANHHLCLAGVTRPAGPEANAELG